jgi:hypothetical protein
VIHWDGVNVPKELLALPPGRYQLTPLDESDGPDIDDDDGRDTSEP